jgi:arylsulfatase A-like enzyme
MVNIKILLLFLLIFAAACQNPCPEGGNLMGTGRIEGGKQWCSLKKGEKGKPIRHGLYVEWYTPEQKKLEGKFKNGRRDGTWTAWYPNGKKKDEGQWRNGKTDGLWSYWYRNGQLRKKGIRKGGNFLGKWMSWHEDGQLRSEETFSNGVKDGMRIRYNKDGDVIEKGLFKNDTRKGRWVYVDKKKKKRTVNYDYPNNLMNDLKSRPRSASPIPEGKNILLIVVDAMRADGLNPYGYDKPTSPAIGKLAREGIVFEDMHAASPWTAPSFATIFTGVSPTVHRVGWRLYRDSENSGNEETMLVGTIRITRLADGIPTIAKLMKSKGVTTGAIVNNAFLHPDSGLSDHFDYYDLIIPNERNEEKYKAAKGNSRRAKEVTSTALAWLSKQTDNPFFLILHYFDPHVSYSPPKKYIEQFATFDSKKYERGFSDVIPVRQGKLKPNRLERKQIRGLYDGEVRYTDDQIKRILTYMEKKGLLKNTWIVFAADHGEELFDHGFTDHGHRYEEEVTRVPFIIRAPGGKWNAGVRIPNAVRHIDIVPTLLELMQMAPTEIHEGKSVLSLLSGKTEAVRPAYMEYNLYWGQQFAWYDGQRYKLIEPLDSNKDEKGFLYDLDKDPKEKKKLDESHPMYSKLHDAAMTHRAMLKQRAARYSGEAKDVALSKEVEESLRALGYIDN